ncbi:bacterial transcriptional activator domain-containing protein, partial [Streptomyces sp. NPDC051639]|uniref:AfsR/SARP family transcriptional regulator n=1 Tax=Streptomyces sp. NPDC051639 TaxID=3155671 RepID=UPI00342FDF97
ADEAQGAWQHVPGEPSITGQAKPIPQKEPPVDNSATSPRSGREPNADRSGTDDDDVVFPALLKASADPAALSLAHAAPATAVVLEPRQAVEEASTDDADASAAERTQPQALADEGTGDAHISQDGGGPEIRVLGPVDVDGLGRTGHGPRTAQLAALLYFRPGRTADVLCADMDPLSPWSIATLNARLQGLRRALGNDQDGDPYVPRRRNGDDPYMLADGVRCEWTHFVQLAERALPQGPAGLADLEQALTLVRGRPFGTRAPAWAEPHQQEMTTRIIDVAHTVATHRTQKGLHQDLGAARKAIAIGLDVDETAELLYRDWLIVEWTAKNRPGLHTAITRIQQVAQTLDCDLELETEQLIQELLTTSRRAPTP